MMKKKNDNLNIGDCRIRKGTTNAVATRRDLEKLFLKLDLVEIVILDTTMCAFVHPAYDAHTTLNVIIRNYSEIPVCFMSGSVCVYSKSGQYLTRLMILDFKEFTGGPFNLEVTPKRELVGEFFINFGSSDCLRLGLDEKGYSPEDFNIVLSLTDTYDQEYTASAVDVFINAKGNLLWKVQEKEKEREAISKPMKMKWLPRL